MLIRHQSTQTIQHRAAFTLMEMIIVVAIIVALAGIGGFYLLGQLSDAQRDIAKTHVTSTLTNACRAYAAKHAGAFPDTLAQLLDKDELGYGPYLESQSALRDPWNKEYQYDKTGTHNRGLKPDIWTIHPSGVQIGNWDQ